MKKIIIINNNKINLILLITKIESYQNKNKVNEWKKSK